MTTPYLALTDGTTTVEILNGTADTSYILESGNWTPSIAGRNVSTFGGKPYSDVTEEMTLSIRGSNAADCYSKLATLTRLLDQADAWYRGANVDAVTIQYAPLNATVATAIAPMYAVILGRAGNSDETAAVTLSNELDEAGLYSVIKNVRVRFRRRGLWLHISEQSSGGVNTNGSVSGVAFGDGAREVLSPTQLQITNWYGMADAYLIFAPDSSYIGKSPSTDWTVYAGGANVTRTDDGTFNSDHTVTFTWGATAGNVILQATMPTGFTDSAGLIDVYIRYSTSGAALLPTVRLVNGTTSGDTVSQIPAVALTQGLAQLQFLGTLSAPPLSGSYTRLMLDFRAVTSSTSLTIESVLLVARSSETYTTQVMRLNSATSDPFTVTNVINPRVDSDVTPLAYTTETHPRVFTTYGDIAFHSTSAAIYVLVYAVWFDNGVSGIRRFYHWPADASASGGGIISHSITATRIQAYLTPQ